MDSVTVLLHRRGVAYLSIMNPRFTVRRGPAGELLDITPVTDDGAAPRRHRDMDPRQLSPSVDRHALAEAERLLPDVLADNRQVALDSARDEHRAEGSGRRARRRHRRAVPAGPDRGDVADLLRWLAKGISCCSATSVARCVMAAPRLTESSRLGVLRLRDEDLPQLTDNDDLLVLAQATIPSYLRYGAYPYIVVVRESPGSAGPHVVEHRFVGLFTVAAMNANVLEIPLISRRVHDALAMAAKDPQPTRATAARRAADRAALGTVRADAQQLHDMAMTVIDLGSRRRTLLFARADEFGHFVSCLVYLPRDRYTTAVRLEMQDILVREFGGVSIEYSARVSESPWALVHFTVKLPDGTRPQDIDVSSDNETGSRPCSPRRRAPGATGCSVRCRPVSIDQAQADHYATAFSEGYKQIVAPLDAIADIAIIEDLQRGFGEAGLR